PGGDGGPAPAAGRRRSAVRPADGRRARRGPGVRPQHHTRRGGQLPRARDQGEARRMTLTEGFSVTHKRYVPHSHAHYGGDLVDGAYGLGMFGDVATELCIRTDGDEGLFAGYTSVEFLAPIKAGDVLEATATVTRIGNRSRTLEFEARVVCR